MEYIELREKEKDKRSRSIEHELRMLVKCEKYILLRLGKLYKELIYYIV